MKPAHSKEIDDIIFIYLPHLYLVRPSAQTPIGILYLATILKKKKYKVSIKNFSTFTTEQAIDRLPKAKMYGITATSTELPDANVFAMLIKEKYPESKVIIGGPASLSKEYIDFRYIDSCVTGEAENIIRDIMADLKNDRIKQHYTGMPVEKLDELPMIDRELLPEHCDSVFVKGINYKGYKSVNISTRRGCYFSCAFCAAPKLTCGKVRYRDPYNVAEEIKYIIRRFNIKQFRFTDDTFNMNQKYVLKLCKLLKDLDIAFRISARVVPLEVDTLMTLRDAGCKELSFGVESFDDKVLKLLNKASTVSDAARALKITKTFDMLPRTLLMIRTPGQTWETIKKNIHYLKAHPYTVVSCTSFVPMPGSEIWNNPDKYGIEIINKDLRDYNFYFYGPEGKRDLNYIIKIKEKSLIEFQKESDYFRDWLEKYCNINMG